MKQEEALGTHLTVNEEITETVETIDEIGEVEEEIQQVEKEVLPDLDNLDLSEFDNEEPKEFEKPIPTVKQIEKESDIIGFNEFYRLHWAMNWQLISFFVGLGSINQFKSEEEFARVAYRRLASYETTRGLLRRGGQLMADLMIIGASVSKIAPAALAERAEKKAKQSIKKASNDDKKTDFKQFVAR